jgi:hypothetical protein
VLATASLPILSCNRQPESANTANTVENLKQNHSGTVSIVQAVDLATKELLRRGKKLEDWMMIVVSNDGEWIVRFAPRQGTGGTYRAGIDKNTGKMSFEAGD